MVDICLLNINTEIIIQKIYLERWEELFRLTDGHIGPAAALAILQKGQWLSVIQYGNKISHTPLNHVHPFSPASYKKWQLDKQGYIMLFFLVYKPETGAWSVYPSFIIFSSSQQQLQFIITNYNLCFSLFGATFIADNIFFVSIYHYQIHSLGHF